MDRLYHPINPIQHIDHSQHNTYRNVVQSKLIEVERILRNSDDQNIHETKELYVVVVVVFWISSNKVLLSSFFPQHAYPAALKAVYKMNTPYWSHTSIKNSMHIMMQNGIQDGVQKRIQGSSSIYQKPLNSF